MLGYAKGVLRHAEGGPGWRVSGYLQACLGTRRVSRHPLGILGYEVSQDTAGRVLWDAGAYLRKRDGGVLGHGIFELPGHVVS